MGNYSVKLTVLLSYLVLTIQVFPVHAQETKRRLQQMKYVSEQLDTKLERVDKEIEQIDKQLDRINDRLSQGETQSISNAEELKRTILRADLNTKNADENTSLSESNKQSITDLNKGVKLNTDGLLVYGRSQDTIKRQILRDKADVARNQKAISRIHDNAGLNKTHLNRFWMLLAALLVFFMQAGFKVYEVGLVSKKDRNSVGIKNLLDWMVITLIFYSVGFAFMFGHSIDGWVGYSFFGASGIEESDNELGYEFFLFQIAFAATATTIVSGALAVRTMLFSYMLLAVFIGGILYPIFGHWVWGHLFLPENKPWLASMGFLDFAGGTVVHSLGAWIALVGAYFIRPRIGKWVDPTTGRIAVHNIENFRPYDLSYSVLGLFILWVGWWGFNGGSTAFVSVDETNAFTNTQVPSIILNTTLAAAASGIVAFLHSYFFQHRRNLYEKLMGGTLGGLVAITPCANVVSVEVAVFVVGAFAGIVHNLVYDRLNTKPLFNHIIDDPVGAIAVHGPCGAWGTLCVAFGNTEKIKSALGPFYNEEWTRLEQFGDQLFGVIVCFLFAVILSILIFSILRITLGLEVSAPQEREGDIIGLRIEEKADNIGLTI